MAIATQPAQIFDARALGERILKPGSSAENFILTTELGRLGWASWKELFQQSWDVSKNGQVSFLAVLAADSRQMFAGKIFLLAGPTVIAMLGEKTIAQAIAYAKTACPPEDRNAIIFLETSVLPLTKGKKKKTAVRSRVLQAAKPGKERL
ncbi:MAG: hypothetical protein AB7G80_07745 [Dongiaceae bacterium]